MAKPPEIRWLEPTATPWAVPVLDVRPLTLTLSAWSKDQRCAANAISFGRDDGTSFIGINPVVNRTVATSLRFPIDRVLADGVLFAPRVMEEKWALFYHRGHIICVRSWLRQVVAVGEVRTDGGLAEVTAIHGVLTGESEDPDLTTRAFDYLVRSHALNIVYPVPLPIGMQQEPESAAMWCFSCFGNRAHFATPQRPKGDHPHRRLRTHSLLHIAIARGDLDAARKYLESGLPVDLLAGDGLAPLHWALSRDEMSAVEFLLDSGSPVDVRSEEGATPLMNAVQARGVEKVIFLLDRGANPNATDKRGFTALHRAAEMGHEEVVEELLRRGASAQVEAQGHTPRSLAEKRGQRLIVEMLDRSRQ